MTIVADFDDLTLPDLALPDFEAVGCKVRLPTGLAVGCTVQETEHAESVRMSI